MRGLVPQVIRRVLHSRLNVSLPLFVPHTYAIHFIRRALSMTDTSGRNTLVGKRLRAPYANHVAQAAIVSLSHLKTAPTQA